MRPTLILNKHSRQRRLGVRSSERKTNSLSKFFLPLLDLEHVVLDRLLHDEADSLDRLGLTESIDAVDGLILRSARESKPLVEAGDDSQTNSPRLPDSRTAPSGRLGDRR